MEQEKIIRESIFDEVFIQTGKKVRSVFKIGIMYDGSKLYGICGNNGKMFCAAKVDNNKDIELFY